MTGKLFVIATPIGNLSDITLRAIDVLREVDVILAEDTRVTNKLLERLEIRGKKLIRYDQHSFKSEEKKLEILNLLLQGNNLALVTDAGTPGISDPGNELIDWLFANHRSLITDHCIFPIPGPSSVTAALSVCGFDVSSYLFVGFLPKKKLTKVIELIKLTGRPVVFFESPFRISKTLEVLKKELGEEKRIFIGRELTKMHEEHLRGTLAEVAKELSSRSEVKGELVGVIEIG